MDIVTILRASRELWRRRVLVAGVCVLAVLVGVAVEYQLPSLHNRHYDVGIATANILVDTPSSEIVNVAPRGSDSTAARASLMASLMVDGEIKSIIAHRAGLPPGKLVATTSAAVNASFGPGAATAPPSATVGPTSYLYTTTVPSDGNGNPLPIIELSTQAPTAAGAAKLANAAISGLEEWLQTKAVDEGISNANRLQVGGTGAPQATVQANGPSSLLVMVVVLIVLLVGCAGILAAPALARSWRAAGAAAQRGGDAQEIPDVVMPTEESFAASEEEEEAFAGVPTSGAANPPRRNESRAKKRFSRPVRTSTARSNGLGHDGSDDSAEWAPGELHDASAAGDSFRRALHAER